MRSQQGDDPPLTPAQAWVRRWQCGSEESPFSTVLLWKCKDSADVVGALWWEPCGQGTPDVNALEVPSTPYSPRASCSSYCPLPLHFLARGRGFPVSLLRPPPATAFAHC